jgi:hypothetical protein
VTLLAGDALLGGRAVLPFAEGFFQPNTLRAGDIVTQNDDFLRYLLPAERCVRCSFGVESSNGPNMQVSRSLPGKMACRTLDL